MAALPVDHSEVKKRIEELIERDGLETVTSSKIRAHLKSVFDVDFSECKKAVDEITKDVIEKIQNKKANDKESDSDSDSDDEPAPSAKEEVPAENPSKPADDSSSDDSDHGIASSPVKKGKKRKAAEMDTSNMDLMSAIKTGRRAAAKQAANNLKKIGAWKTKEKEGKKKEPGKITKGSKLVYLSDELQDITGQRFMRRCDVVKAMWAYVKEHERMDPKDKRYAIVEGDEKLERIFKGKKRLQMFGVMGHLGHRHLMNPSEISEELVEECEAFKDKLIAEYQARVQGHTPAVVADSDGEDSEDGGETKTKEAAREEDNGDKEDDKKPAEESGSEDETKPMEESGTSGSDSDD